MVEEGGTLMGKLVCEGCGYAREVRLEADNGREVTIDEYMAALEITGQRLLCGDCAAAAGAPVAHGPGSDLR